MFIAQCNGSMTPSMFRLVPYKSHFHYVILLPEPILYWEMKVAFMMLI